MFIFMPTLIFLLAIALVVEVGGSVYVNNIFTWLEVRAL